jgi:succinate-acetate transporter protein
VDTRAATAVASPLGSPLPMSLAGLALASFAFATLELGWLSSDQRTVAALAVLTFSVPLQLVASVLGLVEGDTAAGTAAGILAGTWAATGTITVLAPGSSSRSAGLGVILLASAALLVLSAISSGTKLVLLLTLAMAAGRFAVTGIYQLTGAPEWKLAAGWVGLAVAAGAWYAVAALELEGSYHRRLLPVGRPLR